MAQTSLRILIVEDTPERQEVLTRLCKDHAWVLAHTARRAVTLLEAFEFHLIFLDYDLAGEEEGDAVAAFISRRRPEGRVIVHAMNAAGAQKIRDILPQADLVPFSKLVRDNLTYRRLQQELARGTDIRWDFVFRREKSMTWIRKPMRNLDLIWRDLRIVGRAVWFNLALFLGLVLGAGLLLGAVGSYPGASFSELLVLSFHMTHLESVPPGQGVLATALIFGLPVLTIIILGEGALRVVAVYIRRRQRREVWDPLVAQTFSEHALICGLGELGRAICTQMLEKDSLARIVLVDVRVDLLAELGITESRYPNVIHIHGDMTSIATLEEANCRSAGLIIITSGEDGHNLEAGVKVQEINNQGKIWIRLHRSKVAQLICPRDNVHFFSPYQKAAETLLLEMDGEGR